MDIDKLTIGQAHESLKRKEFSATELADACISEAEKKNPDINAYLEIFDDVREQAKNADERIAAGYHHELNGIPLALKDNILIQGEKVSAASKILEGYRATYDATVTAKLKDAGAVFVGRTNMDEFAMGSSTENSAFGVVKNPIDTSRVAGGSSGGSAAAVAMGSALGALGSDTGGSVRQPASFCGLVGLKPTYGAVSRSGLIALGSSLDQISPFAKTVADAEILFNAIAGPDIMDSTSLPEKKREKAHKRVIGVPRSVIESEGVGKETITAFNTALEKMEGLGYEIVDVDLPNIEYSLAAYYIIMPAEASSNLARFDGVKYGLHVGGGNLMEDYFKTRGEGFGAEPRRRIMLGTHVLSSGYYDAYYNKAVGIRRLIASDYEKAFEKVGFVVTPTTPAGAFTIGEKGNDPLAMYKEDLFTVPANITGMPALTVPMGNNAEEMPLGLQLIAPRGGEGALFAAGKAFLGEEE